MEKHYRIVGIMSGTSMDGLDIACVDFSVTKDCKWHHNVAAAETITFPENLLSLLAVSKNASGIDLCLLDLNFGEFIGNSVNNFLQKWKINRKSVHAIASHGHTIFHQPNKKLTLQIGNGALISKISGIDTINNFREKDVLFGGQGAPLVPIGDFHLFSEVADTFLNLGGFSNISHIGKNSVTAFDISPCNLVLNKYAQELGVQYDKNGELGRASFYESDSFFRELNHLDYYTQNGPKSLGTEWLEQFFLPILEKSNLNANQKLSLCYQHIAYQIRETIQHLQSKKVLVTGGGAKNSYLLELMQRQSSARLIVPDENTLNFKEAIVFAFLGVLFLENKPNCLASVTGASKDVCGGVLHRFE